MTVFNKSAYERLFYAPTPVQSIIPTPAEKASVWFISSLEFIDKAGGSNSSSYKPVKRDKIKSRVCRKGFRKEVRICTEVHTRVVEETYSDDGDSSDVEVDECTRRMTKKQLLKRMVDVEGRLAAIEQLVKQAKVTTDAMEPDVNHPPKEIVGESKIVIELRSDVENPNTNDNAVTDNDVGVEISKVSVV